MVLPLRIGGRVKRKGPAKRTQVPDRPAEPTDRERILWLLDFLRQDLATTRPGALFDLRDDVMRYLHRVNEDLLDASTKEWWTASRAKEPHAGASLARELLEDVEETQSRLREGISTLSRGQYWQPFAGTYWTPPRKGYPGRTGTRHLPPDWIVRQTEDGALVRIYQSLVEADLIIAAAVDVLMRWWPQLRRCKHCGALFLPRHGRQWYHDAECSWKARYARFKPKRDYVKEERRRAARELAQKTKGRK